MRFKTGLLALFMSFMFVFAAPTVSASSHPNCEAERGSFLGLPTWYKFLPYEEARNDENQGLGFCEIKFDATKDAPKVLLAVFEILLRIAGMAAVIFVIVGGFQYILTQGEPDKAKAAKGTIVNALIGLVIAISATVIVNFFARSIL